ncbi:MAG: hypothetical protein IT306_13545 [Chloroflexi bacterium]|nr:hypothetical protein [Chloroflexota bacterium]
MMVLAAVAVGCLFFVAASVVELATGGDGKTSPAVYAGLLVFFGGMAAVSGFGAWKLYRSRPAASGAARPGAGGTGGGYGYGGPPEPPRTAEEREQRVLDLARAQRGRVTLPEVASACDMTVTDSKETLDTMVLQGIAELRVTETGVLVYVFPGFLSDEEKRGAQDF